MCGFIGGAINYLMVNYLAIIVGRMNGFSCLLGGELVISRAKVLKRSEICAFSFDYQKVFVNFAPV